MKDESGPACRQTARNSPDSLVSPAHSKTDFLNNLSPPRLIVLIFFTGPFLKNPDGEEALARKLVDAQKEASSYKKELGSCLLVFIKVLDFFCR